MLPRFMPSRRQPIAARGWRAASASQKRAESGSVLESGQRALDIHAQLLHAPLPHHAEVRIVVALTQVDRRDGGRAELPGLGENLAFGVHHIGGIVVAGGCDEYVVLDRASFA